MRMTLTLCLIGLCVSGPGCSLFVNATKSVVGETSQCMEEFSECVRNRKLANEAWATVEQAKPKHAPSNDYADGFKAGFADYLEAGGTGEPPLLPPHRYWKARYETPQGYHAIEDWFDGFRHGAAAARASGYRQWVTVPVANAPHGVPGVVPALPLPAVIGPAPERAVDPVLPFPRAVVPPSKPVEGGTVVPPPQNGSPAPQAGASVIRPHAHVVRLWPLSEGGQSKVEPASPYQVRPSLPPTGQEPAGKHERGAGITEPPAKPMASAAPPLDEKELLSPQGAVVPSLTVRAQAESLRPPAVDILGIYTQESELGTERFQAAMGKSEP